MKRNFFVWIILAVVILQSCSTNNNQSKNILSDTSHLIMKRQDFQKDVDGKKVDLFTLKNKNGMTVQITNFGGRIVTILVPDKKGNFDNVTLGYENIDGYLKDNASFGAIIGRYANRVGHAKFSLNGQEYKLEANNGPNTLHGGIKPFSAVVWDAKEIKKDGADALELTYTSKDMEEGFPGNLAVKVTFCLNDSNEIKIDYEATTDKQTVVNLTAHPYFNLEGVYQKHEILETEVFINADNITPIDSTSIPTGELMKVKGTPFDFTTPVSIGSQISGQHIQLKMGNGFDHNFVLNKKGKELALATRAYEKNTGRVLEMLTTEPAVQFYTGNFLDGKVGFGHNIYNYRFAFCFEAQHYPDSPNKPAFPTTILNPGEKYTQTTVYKFSVK